MWQTLHHSLIRQIQISGEGRPLVLKLHSRRDQDNVRTGVQEAWHMDAKLVQQKMEIAVRASMYFLSSF